MRASAPCRTVIVAVATLLALGACTVSNDRAADQPPGFIKELPEQVVALAAPYQNIKTVRLMPEDGCYWYQHIGPVETTMLPLRTLGGNPICTAAAVAAQTSG